MNKITFKALIAGTVLSSVVSYSYAADHSFTMATTTPTSSPWGQTLSAFKELASEYTEGQFEVQASFGGALGNDTQLLQKSQLGSTVQGAQSSGANLGSVVNVMRSFDIPFIVSDPNKAMDLFYPNGELGGPVVEELQQHMAKKNLRLLYVLPFEFRGMMTTEKVVRSPADMQGLKIRVTPSEVERDMITNLGAGATTLGISEVYTALQTGTVDGLAIPPITAVAFALGEVGKQFNLLNFQPHGSFMVVNAKAWNALPAELQDQVQRAADDAVMKSRPLFDKALDASIEQLKSQDVNVYVPTEAEQNAFAELITDSAAAIATEEFDDSEMKFFETLKSEISDRQ